MTIRAYPTRKGKAMERTTPHAFVMVSALALLVAAAPAQDLVATYWQGPPGAPGRWHDAGNWTGGVPNPWVPALIQNGGTAVLDGWRIDSTGIAWPGSAGAARSLALGGRGAGTVEQLGGSLNVVTSLSLGGYGWMPGAYSLVDGLLSAGSVQIDPGPPSYLMMGMVSYPGSTFKQAGGAASISGSLHVGTGWIIAADGRWVVSDAVDEYYPYTPGATYDLAGGALSAGAIYVGYGGKGRMNQSGGANQVSGGLYVGGDPWYAYKDGDVWAAGMPEYYDPGSAYTLSGGWLSARSLHVGQWGRGRFVQTGGSGRVNGTLQIGGNWWWWLMDGAAPPEAGMVSDVAVNVVWPGDGVYELHSGEMATASTEIGVGGAGQFIQTGGVHRVAGKVRIGGQPYWAPPREAGESYAPYPYPGPSSGRYILSGGELRADGLEVGAGYPPVDWLANASFAPWVSATMHHSDGVAAITGAVRVRGGLYRMTGGILEAGGIHVNGEYYYDSSQFVQSGGLSRTGGLYVGPEYCILGGASDPDDPNGFAPAYGHQVFTLSGGVLQADHVQVTGGGTSLLNQTGGELRIAGALRVTGAGAGYTISGGSLNVSSLHVGGWSWYGSSLQPARMSILSADVKITVTDRLTLNDWGAFGAVDGSTIHMFGADFLNYSTDPSSMAGLDHLRLVFSIGPEDDNKLDLMEVAGKDLGFVRAGFVNNFVLHTLQLGGTDVGELRLADTFDNQPDFDGKEALYVRNLIIGPGSRLFLDGVNIYYLNGGEPKQFFCGDANLDGAVALADLTALADNYGQSGRAWCHGDFNADGIVGLADLLALADNYRRIGIAAADATVPEPATALILGLGGAALLWLRPGKNRR